MMAVTSQVARKRVTSGAASANATNVTVLSVMRAPAAFDAVRLILHVAQTNLPGSAVKATVAPSARAGYNPQTAASAAVAFTPVTWNNGGASVTVANAPASADGGTVENDYVSDLIPLASLDRADTPGAPPLLHVRFQASTYCPASNHVTGGPDATTEPDYINGTVSGDQTAAVLGSAPANPSFHPSVSVVFYLRGVQAVTIGAVGDSTMQGSWNTSLAVDGSSNKFNGFHRQLKDLLVARGIPASIEQMCLHGDPSRNFHERMRNALNNLDGAGLTHVLFYPFSTNDTQDLTNWNAAKARTLALIDLAVAKGVTPILCRNPPNYVTAIAQANGYNEFFETVAAAGKARIHDDRPSLGLAASGYPAMPDAYCLHDSGGVARPGSDTHPGNLYHAARSADLNSFWRLSMSKSNTYENDLLKLIFNGVAIANLADNAATSPATNLFLSLHSADPDEAGTQATSEVAYTGYARVPVARTSSGWTVTANEAALTADALFPQATGGTATATHFGIGTASSGTGKLLYSGPITPTISISNGVQPKLNAGSKVSED